MTISARPPTPASWRKDQRALDAVEAERVPLSERVEVWWVGSEEPYDLTECLAPAADLTAEEGVG